MSKHKIIVQFEDEEQLLVHESTLNEDFLHLQNKVEDKLSITPSENGLVH
jgi:hypothetical protein